MSTIGIIAVSVAGLWIVVALIALMPDFEMNGHNTPPGRIVVRCALWPLALVGLAIRESGPLFGIYRTPRCAKCNAKCRAQFCHNCGRKIQDK